MRTIQFVRVGTYVAAVGVCALIAGAAHADVTTERPGSILIFPKVVRDGTRDTVIQVANTGNLPDSIRCFYLNGALQRNGQPECSTVDFDLTLTKKQPTFWLAGGGRALDPTDGAPGLDPGLVPPVPLGFAGALICLETDGAKPVSANKLKGEATIFNTENPDASKYNALTVQGSTNDGDNDLDLNGTEYNACAASNLMDFIPNGGNDPVIEAYGNGGTCADSGLPCNNDANCPDSSCITGQSSVHTALTLLPCNLDFQNARPTTVSVSFFVRDEFEQNFSGSTTISCWGSFDVGNVPSAPLSSITATPAGPLSTPYASARIVSRSPSGNGPLSPVIGIIESFHNDTGVTTASAAENLHTQGLCLDPNNNQGSTPPQGCNRDSECTVAGQVCVLTGSSVIKISDEF
jgi:hypothetical protein